MAIAPAAFASPAQATPPKEATPPAASGTVEEQELRGLSRQKWLWMSERKIQEASVRFVGTTAIVLNRIRLDAVVGGNEVTNPFMVTEVYVPEGDARKLAVLAFTRLLTP
jgi:hypothetical protein